MRIITTVCWVVTAVALAGLALWFLTGTVFGFRSETRSFNWPFNINIGGWESLTGPFSVVGSYSVGTAGVDSIKIDWVAGEVAVRPHDGDEILITEYAQRDLNDREKLNISSSGGTLTIKFHENRISGLMPQKKLEVLIPRPLCDNLQNLMVGSVSDRVLVSDIKADYVKIGTTSGSIHLTDITSQRLDADSTSGSCTLSSVTSEDIKLDSTSGSIHISESASRTLRCDTTSGRIEVSGSFDSARLKSTSGSVILDDSATGAEVNADTTSGSVTLTGSFDKGKIDSISGRVTLTSTIVPSSLNVDTTSGSITVTVPGDGEITVRYSTTSGRFSSDVPVVLRGGSGARFNLSTTSGSIKINSLG